MTTGPTPKPVQILSGALFNAPVRMETVQANGAGGWVAGVAGTRSERFRRGPPSPSSPRLSRTASTSVDGCEIRALPRRDALREERERAINRKGRKGGQSAPGSLVNPTPLSQCTGCSEGDPGDQIAA